MPREDLLFSAPPDEQLPDALPEPLYSPAVQAARERRPAGVRPPLTPDLGPRVDYFRVSPGLAAQLCGLPTPCSVIDARTRRMIERRIMVCLAGAQTQAAWYRQQRVAPNDWEERVSAGV